MGLKSGNKARYYRERKKRNLRRMRIRALRESLNEKRVAPATTTTPAGGT
jgi:hypothetical protein